MTILGIIIPTVVAVLVLVFVVVIIYKKPSINVDGVWMIGPGGGLQKQIVLMINKDSDKLNVKNPSENSSIVMSIDQTTPTVKATYSDPNTSTITILEATDNINATMTQIMKNGAVLTTQLIKK